MKKQADTGLPGSALRQEFPVFSQSDTNLAFLDSAASSQKPRCVIDRLVRYLSFEHANIHRGAYRLSGEATARFEESRAVLARFVNAPSPASIVFTRGTTEAVNLVAYAAESFFRPGDTILLTILEHHSNIVPWQMLAARKKLRIEFVDILDSGELDIDDFEHKVEKHKPKLVSITKVSNALGSIVPLESLIPVAKQAGAMVFVDAAQAVPHGDVDVVALGADFLAFSGHKMYGPTGIGVLYAREELLEKMAPFMGGGDMIEQVAVEGSTWAAHPQKFEAGTPAIAEAIALQTAVEFMQQVGLDAIRAHEAELFSYAVTALQEHSDITLYGPVTVGRPQASIVSFTVAGIHPHDLATVADSHNVQFRAGHHCAMPLLKRLGVTATARISFGVYNTKADVDQLLGAISAARKLFA